MIKREITIVEAKCDGCNKNLACATKPGNVNCGILQSSFGYGSPLDDMGDANKRHLCEECWARALAAVGLKP